MSSETEQEVLRLFARVTEALARATWALLSADVVLGRSVVEDDEDIDEQVQSAEERIWRELDRIVGASADVRHLVRLLSALSELERSADLAEHIAQRAVFGLGGEMTPVSRGIVQRMSEVAIDMWKSAAEVCASATPDTLDLAETDEELDILHDRLTVEVAAGSMQAPVAAQVTLLARFYERLGDHAVNLSRRLAPVEERGEASQTRQDGDADRGSGVGRGRGGGRAGANGGGRAGTVDAESGEDEGGERERPAR